ncbi:MAG: T9SS type A sorting domain-containing protein [Bacteroidales bacterium]
MIAEGYGFLPEPGSEVIFNNQQYAPIVAVSGSETFQNLTIEKTVPGVHYFKPQSSIIVNELCRIKTGTWEDATILVHQFHGDLIVDAAGILNMNAGSRLEFLGPPEQFLTFQSFDLNNHIHSIKVKGTTLNQTESLTGVSAINGNLIVENGVYHVGSSTTEVKGNVSIVFGGQLALDKSILMINNLHAFLGGTFFSSGIEGDKSQILKASTLDFNFTIDGQINSMYTEFFGMNMNGINITSFGSVTAINNCSFSTPHPNATLLTINNDEFININDNEFNFNLTQFTVAKTNGGGEVNVIGYTPSNSDEFEIDPDGLIIWSIGTDKSAFEGNTESSISLNSNEIIIYPNPSSGSFVVENNFASEVEIKMELFDIMGSMIYNSELEPGKTIVKTDMYKKGIYFLKFINDDNFTIRKLIFH